MDRAKVINYFKKFPLWWAIIIAIIGLIVCASSLIAGILLYSIMGFLFYKYYKKIQVTDQEYDAILSSDIEKISQRSVQKAGVDVDDIVAKPLIIQGFPFTNKGVSEFKVKVGKDKQLRFTPVHVTVINLLEHQLVAYQCILDVLTGKPLNEKTTEYFYKDIVSVSTSTESEKLDDGTQINDAESFKLYTSGGTSITTVINSQTFVKTLGVDVKSDYHIPTTEIEAAVQTLRKFIREKKSN